MGFSRHQLDQQRRDRGCSAINAAGIDPTSKQITRHFRRAIVSCWIRSSDRPDRQGGGRRPARPGALVSDGSAALPYPFFSSGCHFNTLVNPQKITLTCQIEKIALRACDVGIPFAADRHSAPTPCRSSRKPRGVVMAHAVRKDIALRRSSRSAKDFQNCTGRRNPQLC